MPKSYKKKPLASWPDDEKHKAVESPEEEGEKSQEGHMPDPENVESKDVLENAKEMGLYSDADVNEEHQPEVSVADEEEKDVKEEYQS